MTDYELVVVGENSVDLAEMREFRVIRYVGYLFQAVESIEIADRI